MKNPCVIPIMMHISKLKIKGGNMLIERNIKDFLDDLASKSPTPGGGSAAALCGAVAASLVSMVCNLTMGKKKYADFEDELKYILSQSEELRKLITSHIEQDADAFSDVMGAYRMPKNNGEERMLQKEALQHALQKATFVPLRIMQDCTKVLHYAKRTAEIGNQNAVSDSGVAALMSKSAILSAKLNVDINLASIKDKSFITRISDMVGNIMEDIEGLVPEIMVIVKNRISEE